ncbi:prepilin-type N-terminal cleavage/methylation domain-containing protein [Candidatus Aerophobetes bacterium]|nr:prepilin-type N-terminal cleavage/methylation domain-containing protein [Candidatus Aerophobetes bacterium]
MFTKKDLAGAREKNKGFTLIEFLITISIGSILLLICYGVYQSEMRNFQFNKLRMQAIDRLWVSMDRIKKEVRIGKRFENPSTFPFSDIFPDISQTPPSLVFTAPDDEVIAFFTHESDGNLYRALSGQTTAQIIAEDTLISATFSSGLCEVTLSTEWRYGTLIKEESITSKIALRNWRGY